MHKKTVDCFHVWINAHSQYLQQQDSVCFTVRDVFGQQLTFMTQRKKLHHASAVKGNTSLLVLVFS